MKNRVLFVWLALAAPTAFAQSSNGQLWAEYMLNYPFANSFNLENAVVYSTAFTSPKWRSIDYTPTLEYSLFAWMDLSTAVTLAYTAQTEDYNTFEIRPSIGTRIHFTPNRRVLLRAYLRIEQRNFENLDTKEWDQSYRPRARAEALIPINRKSYFENKLWYGIVDFELLFTSDDVEERFANRFRLRMGIGYRLSASSRFEAIYMLQESRNGIDQEFTSTDNILRLRYRHYLRKHTSQKMEGSGN
ncbi:MAG TPA: DUF2490 domain-containing protein [Chryseolinea sp.]|nr:DUF2490 domain-containing protein [Chryseolinea sp.]